MKTLYNKELHKEIMINIIFEFQSGDNCPTLLSLNDAPACGRPYPYLTPGLPLK